MEEQVALKIIQEEQVLIQYFQLLHLPVADLVLLITDQLVVIEKVVTADLAVVQEAAVQAQQAVVEIRHL